MRTDRRRRDSRWRSHLRGGEEHTDFLRKKTCTGRPCGDMAYVRPIESRTGRDLTVRMRPVRVLKNPEDEACVPRIHLSSSRIV